MDLVLWILPKCRQGGRGPKSRKLCRRHLSMAPKVFMRKVMRHYAIKYDVELLLHILVNIFHPGTLFSTVSRAKV